jgi:hypothetical protein
VYINFHFIIPYQKYQSFLRVVYSDLSWRPEFSMKFYAFIRVICRPCFDSLVISGNEHKLWST